jgi:hypothetical protein
MKIKIVLILFILSRLFSCKSTEQKDSQYIVINKLEVAAENGKECSNLNDSISAACKAFITYVKNSFKQDSAFSWLDPVTKSITEPY